MFSATISLIFLGAPPNMSYRSQSQEDFAKARNKALFNELQHFLNPEETQLLSLEDAKKMLKPTGDTTILTTIFFPRTFTLSNGGKILTEPI